MLILRIKRCEAALSGGRLDEAFELVRRPDLLAHRRGQELVDRAVAAFVRRGRDHLAAGRLAAADEDARKAAALAGNTTEVAQLRAAVDRALLDERERVGQRQHALGAARRLVEAGQFTLGGQFAARAGDAAAAGAVLDDLAARRATFDRALAAASAAAHAEQWERAIEKLREADRLRPHSADVAALSRSIGDQVARAVGALADAGRLDAAEALLRRVAGLANEHAGLTEAGANLALCRAAWEHLQAARFDDARRALQRLALVWPHAPWIRQAVDALAKAGQASDEVRSGPLALLNDLEQTVAMRPAIRTNVDRLTAKAIAPPPPPQRPRFLLHVDGAGTFLVLQGDPIHVGPISASRVPDLPLMTAAGAPAFTLSRSDEDYLLSATQGVVVNDRPATTALLADGDRIALGPRCRIEFRRPNPASASASLLVTGARLPWGAAVREVLLMGRELVIGPSSAAHVRTRESAAQVVLHAAEGRLLCRANEPLLIDGKPAARGAEVRPGARATAGATSFAIQAV